MKNVLRMRETVAKTGLSRSTIYEKINAQTFPQPISLGERAIGFIESEIDEWIDSRIAASRGLK